MADRGLKLREIAETVRISKDYVGHILHKILGMRKLSAQWVPRLLTPDNKRDRDTISEQCWTLFKRNPKEFLRRFVTINETGYTLEIKEQSKQWTSPGERAPKKTKTLLSAGKVLANVSWYSHLHRLPGEGQNLHRALLYRIIGPIRRRIAEETTTTTHLPNWLYNRLVKLCTQNLQSPICFRWFCKFVTYQELCKERVIKLNIRYPPSVRRGGGRR